MRDTSVLLVPAGGMAAILNFLPPAATAITMSGAAARTEGRRQEQPCCRCSLLHPCACRAALRCGRCARPPRRSLLTALLLPPPPSPVWNTNTNRSESDDDNFYQCVLCAVRCAVCYTALPLWMWCAASLCCLCCAVLGWAGLCYAQWMPWQRMPGGISPGTASRA